jgi:C-terminal processing protease CtpA/Prc
LQSLGRARVFGETSMGQALPALFDTLPNGDVFIHAWGDFVTGTGVRIEGRGVVPDEKVAHTRAALLAGRDAPLEAALAWIDRARSAKPDSRKLY